MNVTANKLRAAIRLACAAYVALLAVLSLLPSGLGWFQGWDSSVTPTTQNFLHVPAYTGLLLLALGSLAKPRTAGPGRLMAVAAACVGYGLILEIAQTIVPGRTGSTSDAMHNGVGVAIGMAIFLAWKWLMPPMQTEASADARLPELTK